MQLALRSPNFGDVDTKIVERIDLKFAFGGGFAFDLGQPEDPMALQTPVKGRAGQMRDGGRAYRQSSSGSKVWLRKATTMASSSTDRTVDLGSLGPVGASATEVRAFHLAIVFGLTP